MNIFIDLDGPILNNAPRLYRLYSDLLIRFGFEPLLKNDYWDLKRNCIKEETILKTNDGFGLNLIQGYKKQRSDNIESKKYLALNEVIAECYNSLNFLSKQGNVILITARKSKDNLIWELSQKKLNCYFNKILCDFDDNLPAWEVKINLIRRFIPAFEKRDVIIGDTEAEILCGKELGIYSIALTNGIRNLEQLLLLKPNLICEDINEVVGKWMQIKKETCITAENIGRIKEFLQ